MKILQCRDKLVRNMTLWSQGCSELVKLLHGCDKVVARLLQGCYKLVTRLQGLYNLATTLSFLYGEDFFLRPAYQRSWRIPRMCNSKSEFHTVFIC